MPLVKVWVRLQELKIIAKVKKMIVCFRRVNNRGNIDPSHANGLVLYPLKKSENQKFSDVFRGYRKRSGH